MRNIFEELFVLELANNHWGSVDRGLRIITAFSRIAMYNNVRAAIKLQFRDVPSFVHKDFLQSEERYIKKTLATALDRDSLLTMASAIRRSNCLTMATPFDEVSTEWCRDLDLVKIASSDINDWPLIQAIAALRKPVIVSTAGSSLKDIDDLVVFFEHRNIPLAINHCVALYPAEDADLELNQIDFLKNRYPGHTIGLSTHEHRDWSNSMLIAYAKGARTFERHIDIDEGGQAVSPYCSLPHQADTWFKAYHKAKEMCGSDGSTKRIPGERETAYLDKLVRGIYAKRDLAAGERLQMDDIYLAIPLQKGQLSCREFMLGEQLLAPCQKDGALTIDMIDSPYKDTPALRAKIMERGIAC